MIRDTEKRHPGDVITHIQYLKPMKKQNKTNKKKSDMFGVWLNSQTAAQF